MLKVRLLHAAHLHELLHRAIARLPAGKVRATIHIALDDSLHFGCHLGTFWQWAFVMTLHVLSALPVALDDLEAFVTLLLHHLRMLVLSVVAVVAVACRAFQVRRGADASGSGAAFEEGLFSCCLDLDKTLKRSSVSGQFRGLCFASGGHRASSSVTAHSDAVDSTCCPVSSSLWRPRQGASRMDMAQPRRIWALCHARSGT
mmetsp:Transcript_19929/g.43970  ORF Transcript_19929/g.43970 Transcript_19929/m.43970 type:complete len:202 (-) Transcript_19929:80-685(-)